MTRSPVRPAHSADRSRRRRLVLALAALAAGAPVALPAAAIAALAVPVAEARAQTRAELESILRTRTLRNGLEVIVVESRGVPLATVEVNVRNGAFTQPPEFEGLAHLYEHMFFRANRTYPEPDATLERAAELGAVFNGTTQEERVNYYLTVPADSLEGAMRFLDASLRAPLFLAREMAVEREVVIGEYDRQESSPFFDLDRLMTQALYPGNFSRKNTIGNRRVIQTATPAMMREIQRRYYVPNNSALIVTGDVDAERVFALAERIFGSWARGADPFAADPIPPIPPLARDEVVIVEKPVSAVTMLMQWQGPSVGKDRDATFAADVFSDILNAPGSAFQRRLVDSGLWQTIGVNYYTLNHVGPITISGQTSPERLKAAMAALEDEMRHFADSNYFSAEELQHAKAKRAVGAAMGAERASGLAHTIGFWWSVADVDYFMGYTDDMARQSSSDLVRYARTYIVDRPRVTGLLLSPQARRQSGIAESDLRRALEVGR